MKAKVQKLIVLLSMVLSIFCSMNVVYADDSETSVTNTTGTGSVDLKLESLTHDANGAIVPYDDYNDSIQLKTGMSGMVPGDDIDHIIRIHCKGDPMWVRVSVRVYGITDEKGNVDEYSLGENEIKQLNDGLKTQQRDGFKLIDDSGVKTDYSKVRNIKGYVEQYNNTDGQEHYYGLKALNTGDYVDFPVKMHIPEEWGSDKSRKSWAYTVVVEGIQKKNFTPDFNSNDPWRGVPIDVQKKDGTRFFDQDKINRFSVSYEGDAQKFVKVGNNFFKHWNTLSPGDVVKDTVTVSNNSIFPATIYFWTRNAMDSDLADAINLKIYAGSKKIYDGALSGSLDKIVLFELGPRESQNLNYTLTVPAELGNSYALLDAKTTWWFSVKVHYPTGVNTSDLTNLWMWGIGGCVGILFIIILIVELKKNKKEEEDKNKGEDI